MRKVIGLLLGLVSLAHAGNIGGTSQFVPMKAPEGHVGYFGLPSNSLTVKTFSGVVLSPGSCYAFGEGATCAPVQTLTLRLSNSYGTTEDCVVPINCEDPAGTLFTCVPSPQITFPQGHPVQFNVLQSGCEFAPIVNVQANY